MVPKFTAIPGASIPIAVLASMGYTPNQPQTPQVQMAIKFTFALVPVIFNLAALIFIVRYKLSEDAHRAVQKGIAAHAAGQAAVDPLTGRVIPPPHGSSVDDATAWFLDHFSRGELQRSLARGASRWFRDAALCTAGDTRSGGPVDRRFLVGRVGDGRAGPGGPERSSRWPSAGSRWRRRVFHAVRLTAAGRFAKQPIDVAIVRAHLETQGSA